MLIQGEFKPLQRGQRTGIDGIFKIPSSSKGFVKSGKQSHLQSRPEQDLDDLKCSLHIPRWLKVNFYNSFLPSREMSAELSFLEERKGLNKQNQVFGRKRWSL